MKKDPRSKDYAWVLPCLTVKEPLKSIEFYEKAFGFTNAGALPGPDGRIIHAAMSYMNKVVVMMGPENNPGCQMKSPATSHLEMPMGIYVYHHDVDSLYQQAVRAGAHVIQPPQDMFWGDRVANFKDIDGYNWTFATHVKEFDPARICK